MRELDKARGKGEYVPPILLRLGSSADITAAQMQANSDDGVNADNAFPNPTESS
ncbi:hypothetical protein L861_02655 [Litchfieldella anticariensis FP35 = DSM 16096]|uniref:Uncharacterized protein n=1 Tax=Litchfieldella anticariensis (strain DSM 16096 / CECT 5854 / CIP 108499 / LMG 22089 / FP35) TaxID=1121939 RepID=S2L8R6_LITA3|nr:hypothetical protein L861_02655 [Halomonas anticariensis FP35 = DSM 16096]